MKYGSSHFEKQAVTNEIDFGERSDDWERAMGIPEDDIEYDDDCPPLEAGFYGNGTFRFNRRILPERKSPTDPFDPEELAFMRSLTPLVQMEPNILGGMPVFKDTLVPIKRLFDYLLAGKTMGDFLSDFPAVTGATATSVLENHATLFYEEISKAIDSAAMPSSLPR